MLDTSAVLAYATGSIDLGETIADVVDEGGRFGASVVCLAEATGEVSDDDALGVPLLTRHARFAALPALAEDWSRLAWWTRALGASHAVRVLRGGASRPVYVTAAGLSRDGAADLVRRMAGPYRLPDALRRVDFLARHGQPPALP